MLARTALCSALLLSFVLVGCDTIKTIAVNQSPEPLQVTLVMVDHVSLERLAQPGEPVRWFGPPDGTGLTVTISRPDASHKLIYKGDVCPWLHHLVIDRESKISCARD